MHEHDSLYITSEPCNLYYSACICIYIYIYVLLNQSLISTFARHLICGSCQVSLEVLCFAVSFSQTSPPIGWQKENKQSASQLPLDSSIASFTILYHHCPHKSLTISTAWYGMTIASTNGTTRFLSAQVGPSFWTLGRPGPRNAAQRGAWRHDSKYLKIQAETFASPCCWPQGQHVSALNRT